MENGNGVIVQIIDTAATTQQYKTLSNQLVALDEAFIKLTKNILASNKAAAAAKGNSEFTKEAAASQVAAEKLIQVQNQTLIVKAKLAQEQTKLNDLNSKAAITNNKVTISENQLAASTARTQAAQEKATAATQKALSPYQQLSKELDRQRLAAKDLGIQYGLTSPQFLKAQQGVLKLDTQLKTLDKSLGQNQRNVGNYEESFKSAFNGLYGAIDRAIPGAGELTRTVVEGFQKITSEVGKSKTAVAQFTEGGFGFKPQANQTTGGGLTQISNTGATDVNTAATEKNTEANIANAESEKVKAASTEKSTISTEESTAATSESSLALGGLGEGFAAFSTLAFVAAIASAAYYLSQFKSTGNTVSEFLAGLKNEFAEAGGHIVDFFKNGGKSSDEYVKEKERQRKEREAATAKLPFLKRITYGGYLDPDRDKHKEQSAFDRGAAAEKVKIALENANELEEIENSQLQAESENSRAQSKNKKLQLTVRQQYLKEAQETEQKILDNQKANAEKTIETALTLNAKLKRTQTLKPEELSGLRKGDINLAQKLALDEQKFTGEAYEMYKQGVQKKIAYQANAANQLIKLQADADNMQLRADNGLAKAQDRLDKARVTGALDASKIILDDVHASGAEKLKANEKFVDDSIRLIKIQQKNELDNAGLGSTRGGKDSRTEAKTRLAIEVETQNNINKVKADGLKQGAAIQKGINDEYYRQEKLRYDSELGLLKDYENAQKQIQNERLLETDALYSHESKLLADLYNAGTLSAEQYNEKVIELEKNTALERLDIQIETAKKLLIAQSVNLAIGDGLGKSVGTGTDAQTSADLLVKLQIQASDLRTKNEIDNIHKIESAKRDLRDLEKQIADESIQLLKSVVDGGYQAQIDALKKKSDQLSETFQSEKDNVANALLSSKQKAAQDRILNAQEASAKKAIQQEENKVKTKQAQFDKAIAIAQVIENIGVAEVGALKYLSNPITAAFYPEIAALIGVLGGLQLTKVIATPVPKYAKGTKNHPGGLGIVGDAGYEWVNLPNGNSFISANKATMMDLPTGTTVIPHLETEKRLDKITYAGGQSISMKEVADLLRENNKYQKKIADKPAGTRSGINDLLAAAKLLDRQRNYFK